MIVKRPLPKQQIPKHAKKVFSGIIFDIYQWQQKLYDNSSTTFELLKRRDTVNIIPVTSDSKIIITQQSQPGQSVFLGTPGGRVDVGEEAFGAAKRELLEETGYSSTAWELWDSVQPFYHVDWTIYTFLAKGCIQVKTPILDAGEKITLRLVTFDEFMDIVADPAFRDTEIALKLLRAKQNGTLKSIRQSFFA